MHGDEPSGAAGGRRPDTCRRRSWAAGLFSMASAERTTQMLRGAGFTDVRTEEVALKFEVPDVDEYADFIADTAGTIAMALRRLSGDERDAVKAQARAALERLRTGSDYRIPGAVLYGAAS